MFHAWGADRSVGDLLCFRGLASKGDHLEAVGVIEMDVRGCKDGGVVVMLDAGEFSSQITLVVVVNKGDGAHNLGLCFPLFAEKPDYELIMRKCVRYTLFRMIFMGSGTTRHSRSRWSEIEAVTYDC